MRAGQLVVKMVALKGFLSGWKSVAEMAELKVGAKAASRVEKMALPWALPKAVKMVGLWDDGMAEN